QEVVVTDRAVQLAMLDAVATSQDGDSPLSAPRCDEDLPAVQVVADGEQAEGTCYADVEGWRAWPNWSEVFDLTGNSVGALVTKRRADRPTPALRAAPRPSRARARRRRGKTAAALSATCTNHQDASWHERPRQPPAPSR